jgi:hypothetical protein
MRNSDPVLKPLGREKISTRNSMIPGAPTAINGMRRPHRDLLLSGQRTDQRIDHRVHHQPRRQRHAGKRGGEPHTAVT